LKYLYSREDGLVSDTVLYDKDGHVVTITYHRPERMNAINSQMRQELNTAWLRFRDDEDAWDV
jgi:E-phenylitaconyl-CoA hydratase